MERARFMKAFCTEHGVHREPRRRIIVAVDQGEIGRLQSIQGRGQANGITGRKILEGAEVKAYEPNCGAVRALVVPETA